ncbi:helix-turn-helix domain-containing protein [Beijerinckia mobilis]|uniref:helix-turn-helix domain-containing protein n=1 Tax=Beijerinckia mobilis TaxID=231434 RepID=UPI000558EB8F|nr:helix-turn-helix domain-containing protein [Beijerinckia mobilis]
MTRNVPAYALYGEGHDGFPDELHVETITARSARYDWHIRSHRHGNLYQFLFVSSGEGTAYIDAATHGLHPAMAIALPPLVVHAFDFTAGTEGYVISIPANVVAAHAPAESHAHAVFTTPFLLSAAPDAAAELATILQLALAESSGHRQKRSEALTALASLILVWFRRVRTAGNPESTDPAGSAISLVQRFSAQVEEDFRRHPSLADHAQKLGVSVAHMSRVCRQITGRSAQAFVQDRLMLEARRQLAYTSMNIAEIAFDLGFDDPAYFTRFFTRHAGLSPRAYRSDPLQRIRPPE